jgi:hypothetical protein
MADETKAPKRAHKATYARDSKKGGYMIRVEGPHSNAFAGKDVPVTRMDNTESNERLQKMIWSGVDEKTGKPVTLYTFEPRPREEQEFEF